MTMVDRFTSIIDAFDDVTVGLTLDQVAARARLPRSTTHRILDHLVRLDWLTRSTAGYSLGSRAASWGAGHAADLRLREAAAPVLQDLHRATDAAVHLGVLDGRVVVHVDKLVGGRSVVTPTRVGSRYPAAQIALGRAILAQLAPEDVDDAALSAHLHHIRTAGTAHVRHDYGADNTSLAAAVDHRAAIGIVLSDTISPDRYRPVLAAAAHRIRQRLSPH